MKCKLHGKYIPQCPKCLQSERAKKGQAKLKKKLGKGYANELAKRFRA